MSCFVRELVFKGKKVKKADAVRRKKRKGKSEKSNCLFKGKNILTIFKGKKVKRKQENKKKKKIRNKKNIYYSYLKMFN